VPDFSDEAEVHPSSPKTELRTLLLARRRALSVHDRARAAARVTATLAALVRRLAPTLVTAYVPVGSEPGGPDLPELLRTALPAGAGLLLPVLRPDLDLDWARYRGPEGLAAAGRGLREPVGERLGTGAIQEAQLVIVPALAVDRSGVRLGRGGGSYDRALARVGPAALTVALLHDGEVVAALPAEAHDRPVRATVTPSAGLRMVAAT
jgi:5-formyltetrahydrofolate cyclo-ligase